MKKIFLGLTLLGLSILVNFQSYKKLVDSNYRVPATSSFENAKEKFFEATRENRWPDFTFINDAIEKFPGEMVDFYISENYRFHFLEESSLEVAFVHNM